MCGNAYLFMSLFTGPQIFYKSRRHLKILCVKKKVTLNSFYTERPKIEGVTVQSLVARADWDPGFLHRWSYCSVFSSSEEPITEIMLANVYTLNVSEITYKFRIVAIFPNFDFQNLVLMSVCSLSAAKYFTCLVPITSQLLSWNLNPK